jgi:hypothetical protein
MYCQQAHEISKIIYFQRHHTKAPDPKPFLKPEFGAQKRAWKSLSTPFSK